MFYPRGTLPRWLAACAAAAAVVGSIAVVTFSFGHRTTGFGLFNVMARVDYAKYLGEYFGTLAFARKHILGDVLIRTLGLLQRPLLLLRLLLLLLAAAVCSVFSCHPQCSYVVLLQLCWWLALLRTRVYGVVC